MASVNVEINQGAKEKAINESGNLLTRIDREAKRIASNANNLGAGYRTGRWHDHATGETKGNTAPKYVGESRRGKKGPIGIVHPINYAAMKDNYLHNTMLKAVEKGGD